MTRNDLTWTERDHLDLIERRLVSAKKGIRDDDVQKALALVRLMAESEAEIRRSRAHRQGNPERAFHIVPGLVDREAEEE